MIVMVKPIPFHTRFERARIVGAESLLKLEWVRRLLCWRGSSERRSRRTCFSLQTLKTSVRFVLDPLKIALYEYEHELIPIDVDPLKVDSDVN